MDADDGSALRPLGEVAPSAPQLRAQGNRARCLPLLSIPPCVPKLKFVIPRSESDEESGFSACARKPGSLALLGMTLPGIHFRSTTRDSTHPQPLPSRQPALPHTRAQTHPAWDSYY